LGDNLITWKSKKQPSVARSSTEVEYCSLADAAAELNWTCAVIEELGFQAESPSVTWCDNVGANYLAKNPIFNAKSKHIAISYHFVREQVADGSLMVNHIGTKEQLADILTKPLAISIFD